MIRQKGHSSFYANIIRTLRHQAPLNLDLFCLKPLGTQILSMYLIFFENDNVPPEIMSPHCVNVICS